MAAANTIIISDKVPTYQLLAPCFLDDDTYHPEDEIIEYNGTPNENMAPLNEPARDRMRAYQKHLDDCAREKAERMGRPFHGRPADWQDTVGQVRADAEVLAKREMPKVPTGNVPISNAIRPLADRKAAAADAGIKAFGANVKSGRAVPEPIHKPSSDQVPPLRGG